MELPEMLTGDSLTRLLQGAAAGAIGTMALGFGYGGWMLGGTAQIQADKAASAAVVAAIAPICVDQFQRNAKAVENMAELKKVSSWQQSGFIEKGGWAVMPGGKTASSGVPEACAVLLGKI